MRGFARWQVFVWGSARQSANIQTGAHQTRIIQSALQRLDLPGSDLVSGAFFIWLMGRKKAASAASLPASRKGCTSGPIARRGATDHNEGNQ